MSPPRELELKLEVPADSLARLTRSSLLRAADKGSHKPSTLVSVYFDTDKLKLRNKGLSLRVRRTGRRHVQTIKQDAGASAALLVRNEWERDVAGTQPDLDAARDTALAPLLSKKLRRNLKPVFETRVRRTVYPIRSAESEIELAIDKGKVEAGRHSSPLCEVELELKRGESAELFKLARALAEEVPVQLTVKSKAEHGSTGPPCKTPMRKACTRCASRCAACGPQSPYFPTCSLILRQTRSRPSSSGLPASWRRRVSSTYS